MDEMKLSAKAPTQPIRRLPAKRPMHRQPAGRDQVTGGGNDGALNGQAEQIEQVVGRQPAGLGAPTGARAKRRDEGMSGRNQPAVTSGGAAALAETNWHIAARANGDASGHDNEGFSTAGLCSRLRRDTRRPRDTATGQREADHSAAGAHRPRPH
jgi:hypothetical protein